ncbi:MAG TPA: N-acetyl-gamma-glutamyl-phosphate reductase, partial [Actinomycetota bacterium]|nr:N-acetyl-gamma-glutamyl-phosphate reductase [Actinomycetota bacterium]
NRKAVAGSGAVANPGCYPTAAVLALAPLLRAGAVSPRGIVIDAVSGTSGAGRSPGDGFTLSELDGSFAAYSAAGHRHGPEIAQELSAAAGEPAELAFVPHLAPMSRGLLATCYATITSGPQDVAAALHDAYGTEPLVHVLPEGRQPATKHVAGTAMAVIGFAIQGTTAVVTCAIDNLGKGAAGQAVQNANLMTGLSETTGLAVDGVFP